MRFAHAPLRMARGVDLNPDCLNKIVALLSSPADVASARLAGTPLRKLLLARDMATAGAPLGQDECVAMLKGLLPANCEAMMASLPPASVRGLLLQSDSAYHVLKRLGAEYQTELRMLTIERGEGLNYRTLDAFQDPDEPPLRLARLRHLAVTNVIFGGELDLPSLETLHFRGQFNSFYKKNGVPNVRFKMPNIKELELDDGESALLFHLHPRSAFDDMPTLRRLKVRTIAGNILDQAPNLEELETSPAGLGSLDLRARAPNLRKLVLTKSDHPLANVSFAPFGENLRTLRTFSNALACIPAENRIADFALEDVVSVWDAVDGAAPCLVGPARFFGGVLGGHLARLDLSGFVVASIDLADVAAAFPALDAMSVYVAGELRLQHLPRSLSKFTALAEAFVAGNAASNLKETRALVTLRVATHCFSLAESLNAVLVALKRWRGDYSVSYRVNFDAYGLTDPERQELVIDGTQAS